MSTVFCGGLKMSFENVLKSVLEFEGGYVNDPDDAGGETFRGISRANNPTWQGWKLIERAKEAGYRSAAAIDRYFRPPSSMDGLVGKLYRESYWKPFEGQPPLPDRIMEKLFDAGVNVGIKRASLLPRSPSSPSGRSWPWTGKSAP
jgi:lysozyme family protein